MDASHPICVYVCMQGHAAVLSAHAGRSYNPRSKGTWDAWCKSVGQRDSEAMSKHGVVLSGVVPVPVVPHVPSRLPLLLLLAA